MLGAEGERVKANMDVETWYPEPHVAYETNRVEGREFFYPFLFLFHKGLEGSAISCFFA